MDGVVKWMMDDVVIEMVEEEEVEGLKVEGEIEEGGHGARLYQVRDRYLSRDVFLFVRLGDDYIRSSPYIQPTTIDGGQGS